MGQFKPTIIIQLKGKKKFIAYFKSGLEVMFCNCFYFLFSRVCFWEYEKGK